MASKTYSERVNIIKYVKAAKGWRFAPVVKRPNGSIHWDQVLIGGTTESHPEGKYFIEWREDGVRRRRSVGSIPSDILADAQRQRALLDAKAAGVDVSNSESKPATRQLLVADAAKRFLRDTEMNKSPSTFSHYTHCLGLFKESLTKASIDAIDRDDIMDFQAYLYKLGLAPRTVKHKTVIVMSFLKLNGVGKLLSKGDWPTYTESDPVICTDNNCAIHDPRAAARLAENPTPVMPPAPEAETEEEAEERKQQHEQQRKEYDAEQERRAKQFQQETERREQEYEAEQARKEEQRKSRAVTFERILENAPATFTAPQLRVLLRALVNLDPYTFADNLAEEEAGENENEQRSAEEVLLGTIDGLTDEKLTRFALRLALAGHQGIPRESEFDFLTEAESVFVPLKPSKPALKRSKRTIPIKEVAKPTAKLSPKKATVAKKKIAA